MMAPPVVASTTPGSVPEHVAIIMDGNGRWATARGLPRGEGHRRGVEALRGTVRSAIARNIRYLTVYSFSSENWRRPASEVSDLMALVRMFVRSDLRKLHDSNVRIRIIGRRHELAPDIQAMIEEAETLTAGNKGLTLVVAFNYGGRLELCDAARRIAQDVATGVLSPDDINEKTIADRLDTAGIPDPDLVIRTSGEMRTSNFLLWQSAYSEFVFTPVLWPDFDDAAFQDALTEFHRRSRRFGAVLAEKAS